MPLGGATLMRGKMRRQLINAISPRHVTPKMWNLLKCLAFYSPSYNALQCDFLSALHGEIMGLE